MRSLVSGIVGTVLGGLILLAALIKGGPQGSGAFAVGEYIGIGFGFLLLAGGVVYLIGGISEVREPKKKKKRKLKKSDQAEDSFLTIACSECNSPFRANTEHAGRRVKCPTCKASLLVPGEPEEEDTEDKQFKRKRKKADNVPVWFVVTGGIMILVVAIGLISWVIFGEPSKSQPANRAQPPVNPFNNPNFKMPEGRGYVPGEPFERPGGPPRAPRMPG